MESGKKKGVPEIEVVSTPGLRVSINAIPECPPLLFFSNAS